MNYANILGWVKGNEEAARFLECWMSVIEIWDDLVDKDKPVTDTEINSAFFSALINIPRNGFYQANFARLNTIMESVITDWHTANALEATKDEVMLRTSYVMRCGAYAVISMCAAIVGGPEWGRAVNTELRSQPSEWAAYSAKHQVQ